MSEDCQNEAERKRKMASKKGGLVEKGPQK